MAKPAVSMLVKFTAEEDIKLLLEVQRSNSKNERYMWNLVAKEVNKAVGRSNFSIDARRARDRTYLLLEKYRIAANFKLSKPSESKLNRVYEEVYGKDSSYVKTGNEREKWKQLQAILAIITKDDELIQNFPSMTIYRNSIEMGSKGATEQGIEGSTSHSSKAKSNFLLKCPMYCRSNCASKHHPLLVALLNCKDTRDEKEMHNRLKQLEHVVDRYESSGKWEKDDPIPDHTDNYQYPMLHWSCALGFINATKWLIKHGMSRTTAAENFGNESAIQKSLLCLQETCPSQCFERFEIIVALMEPSLFQTDSANSTVLHTCCEYLSNDIPKFQYFQHCLLAIIFHFKSRGLIPELRQLMEIQNCEGNTCLHILARSDRCFMMVRNLLRETTSQSPIVTIMRNSQELRPADVAFRYGSPNIFAYLSKFSQAGYVEEGLTVDSESDDDVRSWETAKILEDGTVKMFKSSRPSATNYTNNKVYDRKGNIIGEKLELQPSNKNTSSGNYIDVGCTSNQQGTEKEEGYETSEVPNKKVKLSHEVEEVINVDKEESSRVSWGVLQFESDIKSEKTASAGIVSDISNSVSPITALEEIQQPPTNIHPEETKKDITEKVDENATNSGGSSSKNPYITELIHCLQKDRPWTTIPLCFSVMTDKDFTELERYLPMCSDKLKEQIVINLVQDEAKINQRQALVTDLMSKYENMQDTQMKLIIDIQNLIQKMNHLKREEENLENSVRGLKSEISTTDSTRQGLRERLQHCKAALTVLNDIYEEEQNDSDN